jgi:hypothetical protein
VPPCDTLARTSAQNNRVTAQWASCDDVHVARA